MSRRAHGTPTPDPDHTLASSVTVTRFDGRTTTQPPYTTGQLRRITAPKPQRNYRQQLNAIGGAPVTPLAAKGRRQPPEK